MSTTDALSAVNITVGSKIHEPVAKRQLSISTKVDNFDVDGAPQSAATLIESFVSLLQQSHAASNIFKGRVAIQLDFAEPRSSGYGYASPPTAKELSLFISAFEDAYINHPTLIEPRNSGEPKGKLYENLVKFLRLNGAKAFCASKPYIVNRTERLLGTPLFVKLLDIALDNDENKYTAIGLINKIFEHYQRELENDAGNRKQNDEEELDRHLYDRALSARPMGVNFSQMQLPLKMYYIAIGAIAA